MTAGYRRLVRTRLTIGLSQFLERDRVILGRIKVHRNLGLELASHNGDEDVKYCERRGRYEV